MVILGILLLAAAGLAGYALTTPVWYDDAGHYLVSKAWAHTGEMAYPSKMVDGTVVEAIPHSPFITLGPNIAWPGMWLIRQFGGEMMPLRWMMVVFSLLAIWKYFAFAEKLTRTAKAGVASLMVLGSIQFLSYGSQFLGEVPMLAGMFAGLYFMVLYFSEAGKPWHLWASFPFWIWAFVTKEYFILPIGLGIILALGLFLWAKEGKHARSVFVMGAGILGLFLVWQWAKWGSYAALKAGWESRGSYSHEFFGWGFAETLPFLLKKPIIWLGAIAHIYKVRIRRDARDRFLLGIFLGQLLWFLASAGYDRFGFQLYFIPAIYLSEFVVFAWEWIGKNPSGKWLRRIGLGVLVLGAAWQKSLPELGRRLIEGEQRNAAELAVADFVAGKTVFTFDQQVVPFITSGTVFLNTVVPSNGANCVLPEGLPEGYVYVEGEYGRTEFGRCGLEGEVVFEVGEYRALFIPQRH